MRIEKKGVKSKNVCFPYVNTAFPVRGGSAESRRGIRSILKVDENPCARSNILAGGKKQKKQKKTEKIMKIVKNDENERGGRKVSPSGTKQSIWRGAEVAKSSPTEKRS